MAPVGTGKERIRTSRGLGGSTDTGGGGAKLAVLGKDRPEFSDINRSKRSWLT